MNKREEQIKILIDLLKRSDNDYVDNLYKLLIYEDLEHLPKVLGSDDWEALKTMIEEREIE